MADWRRRTRAAARAEGEPFSVLFSLASPRIRGCTPGTYEAKCAPDSRINSLMIPIIFGPPTQRNQIMGRPGPG